ncbi:uncharacterized protein JCM10292_005381 [Rhodotorula paludigena]|uniref:uncharacterized protein n=1 Tax=Rhodotorula paludigena TaxID=86838 RepID=UPI0031736997
MAAATPGPRSRQPSPHAQPPPQPQLQPQPSSSSRAPSPAPAPAPAQLGPAHAHLAHTLHPHPAPPLWRDGVSYHHAPALSHYLESSFVPSVVPQPDEYHAKEHARQYLEQLADQVSPGAKLLPFGSMANGFALKNSDMDLCCFLAKDAPVRSPSELVELLGRLIEQETNFYVKMLPRARIPIIKLTMPPTPACPAGMACDIGFENRLALENTRLLLTYAMVDSRLRTLVLFLKVWTKRRKINNPYRGTLSSYGYVLLVIHFLAHVKQPPILPNLQRLPLPNPSSLEELTYEGHDISFFDDLDALPSVFQTTNADSAGELLIDFFRYFSKDFGYAHQVISIRSEGGTMPKVQKGWHTDFEFDPEVIVRDQHKLCIEDPFQLDYNVARTVTRDGLYTIRGEFMRAYRILTTPTPSSRRASSSHAHKPAPSGVSSSAPPSRSPTPTPAGSSASASPASSAVGDEVNALIASLCEEREDYLLIHPADDPLAHLHHQHPHQHYHPHHHHVPPQQQHHPGLQHPQPGYHHAASGYGPAAAAAAGGFGGAGGAAASRGGQGAGAAALQPGQKSPRRRSAPSPRLAPPPPQGPQQQQLQAGTGETEGEGSAEASGLGEPFDPKTAATSASASPNGSSQPLPQQQQQAGQPSLERRSSWDGGHAASTAPAGAGSATAAVDLHRFFQNPPASSSASDAAAGPSTPVQPPSGGSSGLRGTVSLTAPSSPDMAASSAYFAGHPTAYHGGAAAGGYGGGRGYRYGSSSAGYGATHVGPRLAASSVPRNPHTAHHAYTNPYAAAPAPIPYASGSSAAYPSALPHPPPQAGPHARHPSAGPPTGGPTVGPAPIFPEEDRAAIARASEITFGNFPELLPLLPLPSYAHYHASGGSAAYLAGSGGWGSTPYGMGLGAQGRSGNRTHGPGGGLPRRGGDAKGGAGARRSLGDEALVVEEEDGVDGDDDDGDDEEDLAAGRGRAFANGTAPARSEHGAAATARVRGRSAPHVRMGPDGRETLLFGAIEVTLPRAEDVEEADQEDGVEDEEGGEGPETRTVEGSSNPSITESAASPQQGAATGDEEREVAFLGPAPTSAKEAATTDDIPTHAVASIPLLTTQPPTPAKAAPAEINGEDSTASPSRPSRTRPSSPLGESSPPVVSDEPLPRAASPSSNGFAPPALLPAKEPSTPSSPSSARRPSTASSASRSPASPLAAAAQSDLANGIAELHLDTAAGDAPSALPSPKSPRSPKAEKRARQRERRRSSVASLASLASSAAASPALSERVQEDAA